MTVYKRGNRWVATVWTDGSRRWLGTFSTKKEARAAEEAAAPSRGSWGITVDAFCERWLPDYARAAPSTRSSYRYALAPFRKEFGKRRLVSIERPEAQRWATRAPYFQYRTVRTMYADALRDGLVSGNPFSALRILVPEGRRRITVLTESEVQALAEKALEAYDDYFGPTVRALVLTAGFVGLRPGELAALDWSDVDLHRSRIHVRRALDAKGNMRPPKNGEPRTVVVPPPARDALTSLERQLDEPAIFPP